MGERLVVLAGNNVSLVTLEMDDVNLLYKWINNKKITQYLNSYTRLYSLEYEKKWLESALMDPDNPIFGIWKNREKRLIGVISLDVDKINNRALLGIYIGEEKEWGKGYGSEAVILALDYAFYVLGVHKVWLGLASYNKRAYKSYKKLGFKEVGRLRDHIKITDSKYTDYILMDILKKDFDERYKSKVKRIASDRFSSTL